MVVISGKVYADPEPRTGNRGPWYRLKVMTSERYRQDGESAERFRNDYHDISCFGVMAVFVSKHVKKGDLVCVEAKLRTTIRQFGAMNRKFVNVVAVNISHVGKERTQLAGPERDPFERPIHDEEEA